MKTCPDCGCKVYNMRCTWCHEELYILDQYNELDMDVPSSFMREAMECTERQKAYAKEYSRE